jgi:hypothetical protein
MTSAKKVQKKKSETAQEKFDKRVDAAKHTPESHLEKPEHMQLGVPLAGVRGATRSSTPMSLEASVTPWGRPLIEEEHQLVRFLTGTLEEPISPEINAPELDVYDRAAATVRNFVNKTKVRVRYECMRRPYVHKVVEPLITCGKYTQEKIDACRSRYRKWRS